MDSGETCEDLERQDAERWKRKNKPTVAMRALRQNDETKPNNPMKSIIFVKYSPSDALLRYDVD